MYLRACWGFFLKYVHTCIYTFLCGKSHTYKCHTNVSIGACFYINKLNTIFKNSTYVHTYLAKKFMDLGKIKFGSLEKHTKQWYDLTSLVFISRANVVNMGHSKIINRSVHLLFVIATTIFLMALFWNIGIWNKTTKKNSSRLVRKRGIYSSWSGTQVITGWAVPVSGRRRSKAVPPSIIHRRVLKGRAGHRP
jgi:hypothetical protein